MCSSDLTHAFDMLQWLVGPGDLRAARLSTAIAERPLPALQAGAGVVGMPAAVDAEDIALLQLDLRDRRGRTVPAQVNLASVTRAGRGCWLELYGEQATLVLGSANQTDYVHGFQLWMARPGEPLRPVASDPDLAFARTWEDGRIAPVRRLIGWWASAALEGRPMVPGLSEAVTSQRICDAARQMGTVPGGAGA